MIPKQDFILGEPARTQPAVFDFILGEPYTVVGGYEFVSTEKQRTRRVVGGGEHKFNGKIWKTISPTQLQPKVLPVLKGVRWPAGTRGDAVRIEINGQESRSMIAYGDLPGVVIQRASGGNRPGRGLLRYDADGYLSWRAPGSDRFGSSSRWTDKTSWVLEDGINPCAFIVVKVFEDRLPQGAYDAEVLIEDRYNNAIGHDNVSAAEASAGEVEHYAMDLVNVSPIKILDFRVWLRLESVHNGIWIAKDGGLGSADTLWVGRQYDAVYKSSGFSNTIKDSFDVSATTPDPDGVTRDGTNTIWAAGDIATRSIFRGSGFSSTVIDSISTTGIDNWIHGVSWTREGNLTWIGNGADVLFLMSGFTTTILDSFDVTATDQWPYGITIDDAGNILWCGAEQEDHFKQSGWSSTIIDSYDISSINLTPSGMGWDGSDVIWCGTYGSEELYKQSGFSSTLKDSSDISATDNFIMGACHGNNGDRFDEWVQPTSFHHYQTIVWNSLAIGESVDLFVRRDTQAGTPAAPTRLNIHDHNWLGI